ncbi:VOC family protein [Pusillimonas noertemannii]|uniref:2,3-dihydroxy-p-cumate/2,3-dihydroxybenzoate 3,4-dioxygenase n=1 Tax=Pusillimonas noertemannii TaxID=305977 RepID=A0A2U1CKV3_9BURK|nr:VOC family protein [Pusillimonas noertemannii]NYT69158.1 VOC family protein [Pusillimonas noertemannii]PVY61625.1 2,3-dihydroxy-p-cumate/2,3-dihydroxybenzoate 3,4-dioxygenase [Pusillimonas noertemannii]TFL09571.1 glyoxalase [Pusillimonas noertemannii]
MIRYQKFGRVELGVTDVVRARRFYEDIVGLQYVGTGAAGEVLLRCDNEHHSLVLHAADVAGLRVAGFMLEGEDQFAVLLERLRSVGLGPREMSTAHCERRYQQRAIRVFEPLVGAVIEFYTPAADASRPFLPTVAHIQRLGHVVFNTPHAAKAVAFWRDILNFRVSDAVGEMITFMRCWPNPWHHGIGIAQSENCSLHHVNYMVSEIDDIGRALARLRTAGSDVVFGPGRHPASDSIFLYFLDPDGLTMEYSFGMEGFSEDFAREPRRLPLAPEWLDYWGSVRDPRCFTGAGANTIPESLEETV